MFVLKFETGNAAFNGEPIYETARLLREAAHKIVAGEYEGRVVDINGSTVGQEELERSALVGAVVKVGKRRFVRFVD